MCSEKIVLPFFPGTRTRSFLIRFAIFLTRSGSVELVKDLNIEKIKVVILTSHYVMSWGNTRRVLQTTWRKKS